MDDINRTWGDGHNRLRPIFWIVVAGLSAAIIAGGVILLSRSGGSERIEIDVPAVSSTFEVYLSGAIDDEGIYTFSQDSSLQDVLGGTAGIEDTGPVKLRIRVLGAGEDPFDEGQAEQDTRININTAGIEELDTLWGIGSARAQAIVDYRNQNGPFRHVDELINVSGIGSAILESIRDEITVVG